MTNNKIEFSKYKYVFSCENNSEKNYATEKIWEPILFECLCFYWGCPNLEELGYDERGIIRFNTPAELINICNSLTPEIYENMKPYIEHNYNEVTKYRTKDMLNLFFEEFIKINNL